jgi:hypothetical protein
MAADPIERWIEIHLACGFVDPEILRPALKLGSAQDDAHAKKAAYSNRALPAIPVPVQTFPRSWYLLNAY